MKLEVFFFVTDLFTVIATLSLQAHIGRIWGSMRVWVQIFICTSLGLLIQNMHSSMSSSPQMSLATQVLLEIAFPTANNPTDLHTLSSSNYAPAAPFLKVSRTKSGR